MNSVFHICIYIYIYIYIMETCEFKLKEHFPD